MRNYTTDYTLNMNNLRTIMLEATGVEGAALMIPEDIYTTKLKMTTRLWKYVGENIVGWYRFVKHTLGHDIENGDLRVVYGCRKSSGFGIATAFNKGWRENTRLSFFAEGFSAVPTGGPIPAQQKPKLVIRQRIISLCF